MGLISVLKLFMMSSRMVANKLTAYETYEMAASVINSVGAVDTRYSTEEMRKLIYKNCEIMEGVMNLNTFNNQGIETKSKIKNESDGNFDDKENIEVFSDEEEECIKGSSVMTPNTTLNLKSLTLDNKMEVIRGLARNIKWFEVVSKLSEMTHGDIGFFFQCCYSLVHNIYFPYVLLNRLVRIIDENQECYIFINDENSFEYWKSKMQLSTWLTAVIDKLVAWQRADEFEKDHATIRADNGLIRLTIQDCSVDDIIEHILPHLKNKFGVVALFQKIEFINVNFEKYDSVVSCLSCELFKSTNRLWFDNCNFKDRTFSVALNDIPNSMEMKNYLEKVVQLEINRCNLDKIDPSLAYLKNIKVLVICGSNLGKIPPVVYGLVGLEVLKIMKSQLKFVPNEIRNLEKLSILMLSGNKLEFIPDVVTKMHHLKTLCMGYNPIREWRFSMRGMIELRKLLLDGCKGLENIDHKNMELPCLIFISMKNCDLTTLPAFVYKMRFLSVLVLSYNQISSLNENLDAHLPDLKSLYLRGCKFTEIPHTIANMNNLKALIMDHNQLLRKNIDHEKQCVPLSLRKLSFSENPELQEIPHYIFNITELTELHMKGCNIANIGIGMSRLTQLRILNLSNNKLTEFPRGILDLVNLVYLYISSNNSITSIPNGIGNLKELIDFIIHNCNITGKLPNNLCKLEKLKTLILNDNKITEIPEQIGNLRSLRNLQLKNNNIINLPNSICNLKQLNILIISENHLKSLPVFLGDLKLLTVLEVGKNSGLKFLPTSIGNLMNLRKFEAGGLNLHPNGLSENFFSLFCIEDLCLSRTHQVASSKGFWKLWRLRKLDISKCRIFEFPNWICTLSRLRILKIECNLIKSIPEQISDLKNLDRLDISKNQLSQLPFSIIKLKESINIDASSNLFPYEYIPVLQSMARTIKGLKFLQDSNVNQNIDHSISIRRDPRLSKYKSRRAQRPSVQNSIADLSASQTTGVSENGEWTVVKSRKYRPK